MGMRVVVGVMTSDPAKAAGRNARRVRSRAGMEEVEAESRARRALADPEEARSAVAVAAAEVVVEAGEGLRVVRRRVARPLRPRRRNQENAELRRKRRPRRNCMKV